MKTSHKGTNIMMESSKDWEMTLTIARMIIVGNSPTEVVKRHAADNAGTFFLPLPLS